MFILTAPMNVIKENMLWENGCNAYEFLLTTVADCIEEKCIRYADANLGALQAWSMVHGLASIYLKTDSWSWKSPTKKPPKACARRSTNTSTTSAPDIF